MTLWFGIDSEAKRSNPNSSHSGERYGRGLITVHFKEWFTFFRWLTLLLSQEFDLPDILRIWDSLFADPKRFDFLIYVCTAMIV